MELRAGEVLLGLFLLTAMAAVFRFQYRKLRSPSTGWWAKDVAQNLSVLTVLVLGAIARIS